MQGEGMNDFSAMEIEGIEALREQLQTLGPRVAQRVFKQALNFAATPVLKAAIRTTPVRKTALRDWRRNPPGSLKRAWAKRTVSYWQHHTVVTLVGPKSGEAPHAHLLEFGTDERYRLKRRSMKLARFFGAEARRPYYSGKMPAFHILRNAYSGQGTLIRQRLEKRILTGVNREALKKQ